jgi:hypothetical protein
LDFVIEEVTENSNEVIARKFIEPAVLPLTLVQFLLQPWGIVGWQLNF